MKGKGRHTCLLFIEALYLPLKYFLAFSANTPAEGEGEGVTGLAFFSVCFYARLTISSCMYTRRRSDFVRRKYFSFRFSDFYFLIYFFTVFS